MALFKTSKIYYYLGNYFRYFTAFIYKNSAAIQIKKSSTLFDEKYVSKRLNYYNKLSNTYPVTQGNESINTFYKSHKKNAYFFDSIKYLIYFNWKSKINYAFGDVTFVPKLPSLVKSRPIGNENKNSILLKLDKVRHFNFITDKKAYIDKKNSLVWRGDSSNRPHREALLKKLWNHPMCDVGKVQTPKENVPWQKERLTIKQQLEHKFILCIEGFDVATNLKWAMSSNSLVFSYPLKYETWYMEGTLIENYHFVVIKEDLSDLDEKLNYYINNTNEALAIIKNANAYTKQFLNEKREDYLSFLVIDKYIKLQIEK